jgi:tetrapyrrole methylase family protein/MazG family protein
MTITILGLGPGDPGYITRAAWELLEAASTVYLRTAVHPTVAALPAHLTIHAFDELYDRADRFERVYDQIAEQLVERAQHEGDLVYAVPGDPSVAEATTRRIRTLARQQGVAVRVLAGVSFIEPVCAALELDPLEHGLQLLDALDLVPRAVADPDLDSWATLHGYAYEPALAPFPLHATRPALICQVYSRQVASHVKLSLLERFPAHHPVTIVRAAGVAGDEQVWTVALEELDRGQAVDHLTCVFVPALAPLDDLRGPDGIGYVVTRLLGPAGCPWDREQTPQSMRAGLLGETYEVLEALDDDDPELLAEELGDLLMNILSQAEMARQAGTFSMNDVYAHVTTKLICRHPHVFGSLEVAGSGEVLRKWDAIKQAERASKGQQTRTTLDGIPRDLPALAFAQQQANKAAKTGFEWLKTDEVLAKVHEELAELQAAITSDNADNIASELGDLLQALAVLARRLGTDAETALREANQRFRRRFTRMEHLARESGLVFAELPLDTMLELWARAKAVPKDAV